MVNKYDIIVIMLVITLSTIIIIINMKKILNDKLTNIEIKIPEIEIPQQGYDFFHNCCGY